MADNRPDWSMGGELPCPCKYSEEDEEQALEIFAKKARKPDPFRPIYCTSFNNPPSYRGYEVAFYAMDGSASNPSNPDTTKTDFWYTASDKTFAYDNMVKYGPSGRIGVGVLKPIEYKSYSMVEMLEPEDYDLLEDEEQKTYKRVGPYYIKKVDPAKRTLYPVVKFGTHCLQCQPGAVRRR